MNATTLSEVLAGREANRILPFLWMRGEVESVMRREVGSIHSSGIGALCVESRPHPDFCGPGWWRDLDAVMEEAGRRGMRVWVLDDAHFPTGFANGWIRDRFPEKGKVYLAESHADACGPLPGAAFPVDGRLNRPEFRNPSVPPTTDEKLLAVVAARRGETGRDIEPGTVDLTGSVRDGTLRWDVPEGLWRIFVLFVTRRGGGRPDYINPIDADSVRVLIDAVYEPHYARYGRSFGGTFAGFFSDEPGMGNTSGYVFDEAIGRKRMVLPWSAEMPRLLERGLGRDWRRMLPFLWHEAGDAAARTRYAYMDAVTGLYEACFSRQIGNWCRRHGVEYIGHVIEDQDAHARLGPGCGHFFRAMAGQDMAGVDAVLQQILPGFARCTHAYFGGEWDGEFFHFALAKMASSLGHVDPSKKGRAMCELFGAYGWSEGLRLMKWLTDHMLVRGINWIVPHSFSAGGFPDPDCPPHFHARGRNPQFRHLGILMRYANRMCHLLSGGVHRAPVALLYHAEAEWCGPYMGVQEPARVLAENQIDFDIVPSDLFAGMARYAASFDGKALRVNGEEFRCLVIPRARFVTSAVADFAGAASAKGFPVVFLDALPQGIADARESGVSGTLLRAAGGCQAIPLDGLVASLRERKIPEIRLLEPEPSVRYYHYGTGGLELYLFFNENPVRDVSVAVELPWEGDAYLYDGLRNVLRSTPMERRGGTSVLALALSRYESAVLVAGAVDGCPVETADAGRTARRPRTRPVAGHWRLSLATAEEYPRFRAAGNLDSLSDLSAPDLHPSFSGIMRYETVFSWADAGTCAALDLGEVFETAEVWVNDRNLGVRICPPYVFALGDAAVPGDNTLAVEVTNTLGTELRDPLSMFRALEPSGLLGPVTLRIPAR